MNDFVSSSAESTSLLIVDDNPQNLQVLGKMLQENNYKIEFAINGPAALDWLSSRKFDLVLLDINMPGMNGFEVCTRIRSDHEMDNIPVIFLSADTDRESILKGFELGAQDYIIKPFDSRELLVRVKTHLTLKRSRENLEILNRSLEEKVLERTIQLKAANDKLESLNNTLLDLDKSKSEFLNIISHEIRTPLNGILGPLELLKEPAEPHDIALLIEILDTSVKRLERFSLDALLITRLQTTSGALRSDNIDLSAILETAIDEASEKILSKSITISQKNELKGDMINGEAPLIKKLFSNIIDNALFFSPKNGTIHIRLYSEGKFLICEIKDQGSGFEPGIAEKCFQLFTIGGEFRDSSTGLGLPIAKMIADAHHGAINVGNNSEGGAFVKLSFSRS
jgi:two-component system, sensor histidine kinase and response regulator